MIKQTREEYNKAFDEQQYTAMLQNIESEFPQTIDFRIAESPVFVDRDFKMKLLMAANSIIDFIQKPNFKSLTERAIPEQYKFQNESEYPHFLALDFAVTENDEKELEPQLIELQGFPSLFGFQHYLSGKFKRFGKFPAKLSPYFNRLNSFSYQSELEKFLKGDAAQKTVLLEVYPEKQKTRIDFKLTEAFWGIETVCLSQIKAKDKTLFYEKEGEEVEIDRIYNRIIFDELEQKYPELTEKVEILKQANVEWIGNPSWFYRVSKFMLPQLKGKYIPQAYYLNALPDKFENLDDYVLKPLFSFAGTGVDLYPSAEKIESIADKENYILQKKVQYKPAIETNTGDFVKSEIRLLYIWPPKSSRPKLVTSLARLSRGEMIGVGQNQDEKWVGGTAVFYETD
ncbi:hypothetical protein LAG90_01140 [Marinilongibacter aquaticus]|uniref:hypothetical protein n=1 Tax=Marinilongibacter aquaticus TaxID=2975157 RepID=UPI0021BD87ED|nr:hypothetical protein [Marinilongibacter aquaticus]UBM59262.1 hypothetical protein LAG90_01140 [Marinilongibacter aquaticus]